MAGREGKKDMKRLLIFVLLIPTVILTSCNSNLTPKMLASNTQETVSQVKDDNDAVFAEIQRNIDMVADLKVKVQDAQANGKPISINGIIKDIRAVAESYEKLAAQRDDIEKRFLLKIRTIEDMQSSVKTKIDALNQKRADYSEQLRKVDDPNPDIMKTRKKALTQAIKYVDMQIQLWTQFSSIEGDIISEMRNIQQRIDSFLSVIESSSLLFREGLNLLCLQLDINESLSLFTSDLPRIEQLARDMEHSWDNLDSLITALVDVASANFR